ncbi:MAG: class I SAM-dependent methyltransferase [Synergistaceae bacterium]|jgi:2-polyprenyl-3-methyl-5-hydroxy-6-metoxy-1,4-benzoquinol methylase|nr:class I SAM-dependent methyltransferase [Synergistaceae bacterium]
MPSSPFDAKTIDDVRSYWNARPCNIRHSNKEVGTKEYFDEVEKRKYFVEPHIPLFAEFDRWRGKKVLEVGCGIGTDTISFARAGADVTAVDLSDESLKIAARRAEVFGLTDRIRFYRANAEELSSTVPVERYDLVYSFGVIHHTPHPRAAIEQIKKYMDAESLLKLMVYHRISWKVGAILASRGFRFWALDKWIAENSEAQTGCPVTYTYTKRSVETLLSGMTIESMFVDHIFPYDVEKYKAYIYIYIWYFNILPRPFFRFLERRLGWHLCVNARLPGGKGE